MKFCTNCGTQIDSGKSFCVSCGSALSAEAGAPRKSSEPSFFHSRKTKIIMLVLVLLSGSLYGTHTFLSAKFDASHTFSSVTDALEETDGENLMKLVTVDDQEVNVNKEILSGFASYVVEHNEVTSIEQALHESWQEVLKTGEAASVNGEGGSPLFTVRNGEKKWGIYRQPTIEIVTYDLMVDSNIEDVEVHTEIDGEKLVLEGGKMDPSISIVPHVFSNEATIKGEWVPLTTQYHVDPSNMMNGKILALIEFEGSTFFPIENEPNGNLFINGEDTGVKLKDVTEEIGILPTDGSVTLHAEIQGEDGKVFKTETQEYHGEDYVEFLFDLDEMNPPDKENEIYRVVSGYIQGAITAYNSNDFTEVENYSSTDSPIYKELVEYAEYLQEKGITEELLDFNPIQYKEKNDGYNVTVENSYEIFYEDGSSKLIDTRDQFFVKEENGEYKVERLVETNEM